MRKFYSLILGFSLLLSIDQTLAQTYNFDSNSDGTTGSFSNGWSCNTTIGYRWEANTGLTVSSGTGPATDHTTGTTGIYLYTEASTPAAVGDVTELESPSISIAPYTNPGLSFWYHKAGAGMGNLYIDIYSGSTWTNDVDSIIGATQNVESDPWLNKLVNLGNFSGSIKIRFRAEYGATWSGDMAIDDVELIELPAHEAELLSVSADQGYYSIPVAHAQAINFSGDVRNNGADTITNVKLYQSYNINLDSGAVNQLLAGQEATLTITNPFLETTTGTYDINFNVDLDETDTTNHNDSAFYQIVISDSVYARENDSITLGAGFTSATGIIGQKFELLVADTITQVDLKLIGPTAQDDLKVKIYNFTNGFPGTIIDSTEVFVIPTSASAWHTLHFDCNLILPAGEYFLAVEQMDLNNLSLGYSTTFYEPNTVFYNTGASWTPVETSNLFVSLALRMIVGTPLYPTVELGPDTSFCDGTTYTINPGSSYNAYSWSNGSSSPTIDVTSPGTYYLTVENATGCTDVDSIQVNTLPAPISNLNDASICNGTSTTLTASSITYSSYLWNIGNTTNSINVSAPGTYIVTITNSDGCTTIASSDVLSGAAPIVYITEDTLSICAGESGDLSVNQQTGVSYIWSNGTNGPTSTFLNSGNVFVTATMDSSGCTDIDSAYVNVIPLPIVDLGNDTTICDTDTLFIDAGNHSTFNWNTGATTNIISVNDSGTYAVTVTDQNGCASSDDINVQVEICLGIDNITDKDAFNLFPNPAKNNFHIKVNYVKKTTFKLLNIQGRAIMSGDLESGAVRQINVSTIPPGIYFLEISSNDIFVKKRLVIL